MDIRKETIYEEKEIDREDDQSEEVESESSEESEDTRATSSSSAASTSSSSAASTSRVAASATRVHPPTSPPTTAANTTVLQLPQCATIGHGCDTYETPSRQSMRNREPNKNNSDTEEDTASTSYTTSSSSSSSSSNATSSLTIVEAFPQAVTTASAASSKKSLASDDAGSKLDSTSMSAGSPATERGTSMSQSSIKTGIYKNPPCTNNLTSNLEFVPPQPRAVPVAMLHNPVSLHNSNQTRGVNDLQLLAAPAKASGAAHTVIYRDLLRQSGAELRAPSFGDSTSGNDSEPNCQPLRRVATEPGQVDITSALFARSVTSEVSRPVSHSRNTPVGESRNVICTQVFGNNGVYMNQTSQVREDHHHPEISMAADSSYINNMCWAKESGSDVRSAMSKSCDVFGGIFEKGGAPPRGERQVKSLVEMMTYLERCESTDDKLRVVCDDYLIMTEAHERLQASVSESERQNCYLRSEKDSLEKKHSPVVRARDRLRLVCQTLQQQIRELKLENMEKEREAKEECGCKEAIREECRKEVERVNNEKEELVERLRNENQELVDRFTYEKSTLEEKLTKEHAEFVQRLRKENAESVKQLEREKETEEKRLKTKNEEKESRMKMENKKIMSALRSSKDNAKRLKATVEATQAEARVRSALMLETKAEHDKEVARLREEKDILKSQVMAAAAQCANQHDELATKRRQLEECNAALQACRKKEHYRRDEAEKYRVALGKAEKDADSWNKLWTKSNQTLLEAKLKRREQRDELHEAGRKLDVLKALCKKLKDDRNSMKKIIRELKTASKNSRCQVKKDAAASDYRPEVKPRTGNTIGKVAAATKSICPMDTNYGDMDADMAAAKRATANLLPGGETLLAERFECPTQTLMTNGCMSGGKFPRERGKVSDMWGRPNIDAFVVAHVSHVDIKPAMCKPDAIRSIDNMIFVDNETYQTNGDCTYSGKVVERNFNSRMEMLKKFTFCLANDIDIPPRRLVRFSSKVRVRSIRSGADTTKCPKNSNCCIETYCSLSGGQLDDVSVHSFESGQVDSASSRISAKVQGEVNQDSKEPEKEDMTDNSINLVNVPTDNLTDTSSQISSDAGLILEGECPIHWEKNQNNSIETRTKTSVHEPTSNNSTHYDPEQSITIYCNPATSTSTPKEISAKDNLVQCMNISKNEVKCSDSTPAQLTNTDTVEASPRVQYLSATSDTGEELRVLSDLPNVKESASPEEINVQQRSPAENFASATTLNQRRPISRTIITNHKSAVCMFSPRGHHHNQQQCIASKPPIPTKRTTRPAERTVPHRNPSDTPGAGKGPTSRIIIPNNNRTVHMFSPRGQHHQQKCNSSKQPTPIKWTTRPAERNVSHRAISDITSAGKGTTCQIIIPNNNRAVRMFSPRGHHHNKQCIAPKPPIPTNGTTRPAEQIVPHRTTSNAPGAGKVSSCKAQSNDRRTGSFMRPIAQRRSIITPTTTQNATRPVTAPAEECLLLIVGNRSLSPSPTRRPTTAPGPLSSQKFDEGPECPKFTTMSRQIDRAYGEENRCPIEENSVTAAELQIDYARRKLVEKDGLGEFLCHIKYRSRTVPPPPPPPPLPAPPLPSCPQKCTTTGSNANLLRGLQSKEWFLLERDEREGERVGGVKSKIAIIGHIRWLVLERCDISATDSCIADTGSRAHDNDDALYYFRNNPHDGRTAKQFTWRPRAGMVAASTTTAQEELFSYGGCHVDRDDVDGDDVDPGDVDRGYVDRGHVDRLYEETVSKLPDWEPVLEANESAFELYNHDDQGVAVTNVFEEGVDDESEVFGNGGTSTPSSYPDYDSHATLGREMAKLKKVKPTRRKLGSFIHKFF